MSMGNIWKISPGSNAFFWEECKKGKFIVLGWIVPKNIQEMHDIYELKSEYSKYEANPHIAGQVCPQIWRFVKEIQKGDIILANDGQLKIMGVGRVVKRKWYLDEDKIALSEKKKYNKNITNDYYSAIRDVQWDPSFPQDGIKIPEQGNWTRTVIKLEGVKLEKIFGYLKEGGYDIDGFLRQISKPKSPIPEFPDPKTVAPTYIKNNIKSPPPPQESKPKGKKRIKIESTSDEHKKAIGEQGELIVYEDEKRRLSEAKRPDLAKKVERISLKDDSAGYDILSFSKNGSKKYIEVKSTKARFNGKNTKFEITANEVNASKEYGDSYYIYRVFDVGSTEPPIIIIKKPYGEMELEPKVYNATIYFESVGQ